MPVADSRVLAALLDDLVAMRNAGVAAGPDGKLRSDRSLRIEFVGTKWIAEVGRHGAERLYKTDLRSEASTLLNALVDLLDTLIEEDDNMAQTDPDIRPGSPEDRP